MLRATVLQGLNRMQRCAVIKRALHTSIDSLLDNDMDLLATGAHEQAICHRLAVYLEQHTDLNVDCEYNRNMMRAKELRGGRRFRPDIIVHRRLSNDENVLVVETKARAQRGTSDLEKLKELTEELGMFRYWAGAFIIFFNEPRMVLNSGTLRASVHWFTGVEEEVCAVGSGQAEGTNSSSSCRAVDREILLKIEEADRQRG
jgi:hypothetical protein